MILDPVADHNAMLMFTDGSAQGNPGGPVGSGIVIKKQCLQSSPIVSPPPKIRGGGFLFLKFRQRGVHEKIAQRLL